MPAEIGVILVQNQNLPKGEITLKQQKGLTIVNVSTKDFTEYAQDAARSFVSLVEDLVSQDTFVLGSTDDLDLPVAEELEDEEREEDKDWLT